MNREILFRGRVDTWEHCRDYWEYGNLKHSPQKVTVNDKQVDPATVGQPTRSPARCLFSRISGRTWNKLRIQLGIMKLRRWSDVYDKTYAASRR
jgi:hypothetical protein